jgi:protein SCO1/2
MTVETGKIDKLRRGARLSAGGAIEAAMVFGELTSPDVRSAFAYSRALCVLLLALSGVWTGCKKQLEPLPTLGQVGAFSLLDQNAHAVSAETLRGKVWVAAFFFTRCPSICPRITRRMRTLQVAAAQQAPALALISFSVDPENDTPPALLAYAQRFEADLKTWSFLTGDLDVIKRTVVDGFKLALDGKADSAADNGGIIHGSHLVLVDRTLAIRGYYRSDDDADMKRLLDDAARL